MKQYDLIHEHKTVEPIRTLRMSSLGQNDQIVHQAGFKYLVFLPVFKRSANCPHFWNNCASTKRGTVYKRSITESDFKPFGPKLISVLSGVPGG